MGKGKGKGKGKAVPASPQPSLRAVVAPLSFAGPSTSVGPSTGPSTRTYEEVHAKLIGMAKTKKILAGMSPLIKRENTEKKKKKELDDAPPRKRIKKLSPDRSACRLVDGTSTTPPPHIAQPWKVRNQLARSEHVQQGEQVGDEEAAKSTPPVSELLVDWMTGDLKPPVTDFQPAASPSPANPPIHLAGTSASSSSLPPSRKTLHGSNLLEDTQSLESWLTTEDDDEIDVPETCSTELRHLESECIPELMAPEAAIWLEGEDRAADEILSQFLVETPRGESGYSQPASVDNLSFDWSSDPSNFLGQREEFTGTPGPTFPVNPDMLPMAIFLKIFDDDLLDLLVKRTNKHATRLIMENTKKNSRLLKFVNTDRGEIAIFISILILQGLAPLTVEKDYWRENGYLTLKYFKKLMSLERFQLLKRLLNFENNEQTDTQADGTDIEAQTDETDGQVHTDKTDRTNRYRLRKIAPVLDHLNKEFSELYLPAQDIAVDESLLKWHGRLSFAQKIATKAAKIIVKSYELCESATGYLWRFFVYSGKTQESVSDEVEKDQQDGSQSDVDHTRPPPPSNITAKIVRELVEPLFNKGHTLVMDNFYNSPLLARYLKSYKTDCYGTLRRNREFVPESIKQTKKSSMRVGEMYQSYCRDLYVMMWRDTNVVTMISTCHSGEKGGKSKYGIHKYKPQVVLDYNMTMGVIDKKDALISNPIERARNIAWYKKVFRRLLNVTILNSYIILRTQNQRITHRIFRVRLAEDLIKTFRSPPVERPIQVEIVKCVTERNYQRCILRGNHYVGHSSTGRLRCVACKKSRSRFICKQCNVPLCLDLCFERFHQADVL